MKRMLWCLFFLASTLQSYAAPQSLVILHTNDMHGHFLPKAASWRKDHALVGGFVALEQHLDSLRKLYPNTIYLDAGDLMTGNPVCNMEYNGTKGGALQAMLGMCRLSASCLGNHEFDLGVPHLREFLKVSPHPVLCANLQEKSTHQLLTASSKTFAVGSLRLGVVGLMMDDLASVVSKKTLEPFVIADAAATAQAYIDSLDAGTDVIILLTHMGADNDSILATKIHHVDAIIGGHSHTRLEHPLRVNGVIIAQAGSYCENLGVLQLTIDGDSVVSYQGQLDELVVRPRTAVTPLSILSDSLEKVIQAKYGQTIGELAEPWKNSYYTASNVGNWISDCLRMRYKTDIAMVNAGGIRTSLDRGPVTIQSIMELLPFTNSVVIFHARGSELLQFAAEQARAFGLHKHGAMELSGMQIKYSRVDGAIKVVEVTANGLPLQPDKIYSVASIDYVASSQAMHYLGFVPQKIDAADELLTDVVIDEIKKAPSPIHAPTELRVIEVK